MKSVLSENISLILKECFLKMKAPTRTTFRWYRISYFLKTLWLTTFFISYLQQDTFLPKEKKYLKKFIMFVQEPK